MDLPVSPLAPARFGDLPVVRGVQAAIASRGFYARKGKVRDDTFLFVFPEGTSCAGVYTRSKAASADVRWCRRALVAGKGRARALIAHAGNSNAFTGAAGVAKNEATLRALTRQFGVTKSQCFLAATGIIGEPLADPNYLGAFVPELSDRLEAPDWERAARAFMTTDTFPKGAGAVCQIGGKAVHIAGIAKGSGMIAPNMATMLAYVFTDAAVEPGLLQRLLAEGVDQSLNAITVDGDTSTSDTCMAFATGASGAALITSETDPGYSAFRVAFHGVLRDLAHLVVRDGEGAQKFVEIRVSDAKSDRSAKIVAMSIANSPLIKTAIAAGDANWGRIVMAVGKTLEPVNLDAMTIRFGDLVVAQNGMRAAGYDEARATAHFKGQEITIGVDLAVGQGTFTAWTCDLTHGYVDINGAYRT